MFALNSNVLSKFSQTLVKIVDFTCFSLEIVDLSKVNCSLLTNFEDVDFGQNIDVECRPKADKIVDLHFARTPPPLT